MSLFIKSHEMRYYTFKDLNWSKVISLHFSNDEVSVKSKERNAFRAVLIDPLGPS